MGALKSSEALSRPPADNAPGTGSSYFHDTDRQGIMSRRPERGPRSGGGHDPVYECAHGRLALGRESTIITTSAELLSFELIFNDPFMVSHGHPVAGVGDHINRLIRGRGDIAFRTGHALHVIGFNRDWSPVGQAF